MRGPFLLYSTGIFPWSAVAAAALAGELPANPEQENIWRLSFMPHFYEHSSGNTIIFKLPRQEGKIIAINAPAKATFLKYIIESILLLAGTGDDRINIYKINAPWGFTMWIACFMYRTKWLRAVGKKLISINIIKALPKLLPDCLRTNPQLD